MKKLLMSNIMLKIIALALAVITWFYISGEMRRQTLTPNPYSTNKK
jgi:YbbR domain-containing protein